jgi:hypothetical protein
VFPKPRWWERFANRREDQVYGNVEYTFYAIEETKAPRIPDMWNQEKPNNDQGRSDRGDRNSKYFRINTKVGVGAKGKNSIENVHARFLLLKMFDDIPEPEIVLIKPTNQSIKVGTTHVTEMEATKFRANLGATASTPTLPIDVAAKANASAGKETSKTKETTREYDEVIQVANASGVANRAIWEFYRGPGLRAIGQYDLEIIFRIPDYSKIKDERRSYCIDWNVEVNGRRLVDHRPELNTHYWNVTYDGRPVMLHGDGPSIKKPKETLDERKKNTDIVRLESDEDYERLLRPLILITDC